MHHRHAACAALLLLFTLYSSLFAQQVAQPDLAATGTAAPAVPVVATPDTATSGTSSEEVVNMDVFNVSGERDQGYMARETSAGSRVRTALRDTSASISVFTKDFLDDVGAQSIDEMLSYSINAEPNLDDETDGGGSLDSRSASAGTEFRNRGLAMSVAVNGAESAGPVDLYNVDNAEVASGANSILFGMGAQGGTVSLTSLGANLQRNTFNTQLTLGTWSSPAITGNLYQQVPYKRLTYKYNVVLMPRVWALRLAGLFQDGGNSSWRKWMGYHSTRFNPTTTIKPFKGTTIRIGYEKGTVRDATSIRWNATDGITGYLYWLANYPDQVAQYTNNGVLKTFGVRPPAMSLPDPVYQNMTHNISPMVSVGSGQALTYVSNNDTVYDVRNSSRSTIMYWANSASRPNTGQYTLPSALSSYCYSSLGPGGTRRNDFNSYNFSLQQRVGPVNFDLTYTRNKNNSTAYANGANQTVLYYDVNPTISPANYVSAAENVPNPFAGQPYIQYGYMRTILDRTNQALRLQAEYTLNLRQYGRHRFIGMAEYISRDNFRDRQSEALIDENGYAPGQISNPKQNPNAAGNGIQRRHYGVAGDFSTYYGGLDTPITGLEIGGRTYHSQYVTTNGQNNHIKTSSKALMFAMQNYLFNDAIVTTIGGRLEQATWQREEVYRVDATDPLFISGKKALNERALAGTWFSRPTMKPYTFSAGGVWHATDRLTGFINYSSNRGTPRDDGRTTLPSGDLPDLTRGRNFEFGVAFDLSGNGVWNLRLTRFDTSAKGDANIGNVNGDGDVLDNGDGTGNAELGADNLFNIYDALYFLSPTGQTGSAYNLPGGVFPAGTGVKTDANGKTIGVGPMSPAEYSFVAPSPLNPDGTPGVYPYGHPPIYTAGTLDSRSQGYELELTASPTKSIDLRWTFAYTLRSRDAIIPEIFDFFNNPDTGIKHWLDLAKQYNPNSPDGKYWVTDVTGGTTNASQMLLVDYVRNQIYGPGGVRDKINSELFAYSSILGQRPFRFTFTAKYTFQTGFLKGFSAGATARYSSPNIMLDPYNRSTKTNFDAAPSTATDLDIDPSLYYGSGSRNTIRGTSLSNLNAFLTYKCKLFGGRTNAKFQLNVNNIFTGVNKIVTSSAITVDGLARRVYISQPRQFRFTATFDF